MSGSGPPQIVAATLGDPFGRLTWSGIAYHLFTQLRNVGALVAAVDVESGVLEGAARVAAFSPDRRRWRQRYMADVSALGRAVRAARTKVAVRRVRAAGHPTEALLQLGAVFDCSEVPGPRVRASYHDGNLALYLRRADALLDPRSRAVRAALAFERRVYDRTDVIFTMSEWLRRSFIEDFGQRPEKVRAIGAGPNFDELPEPVRRCWEPARLLFVGKGDFTRKGGPVLLKAFARVRERHPDAELWMVGPPADPTPAPGVRYLGRISRETPHGRAELERIFDQATVFVLPSLYEPFGVAFLEAMAYGLPCVGTTTCAMPEIVEDGVTGLLAPPGDADALTDCLTALVSAPDRASSMGAAGRERMTARYTWAAVAARIVDALGEELSCA